MDLVGDGDKGRWQERIREGMISIFDLYYRIFQRLILSMIAILKCRKGERRG